jgi:hypothetical protein
MAAISAANSVLPGIVALLILGVAGGLGFQHLWKYSRRFAEQLRAVKQGGIARFGLIDWSPEGILPNLQGMVDGHKITVDILDQSSSRGTTSHGRRPWTRVRAQLEREPGIVVHVRAHHYPGKQSKPERPTADASFDQVFRVHADEGVGLQ